MPDSTRPNLEGELFDVVVIGGGINGVAIARECAKAAKRVLVIEQNDLASGTTSRSTRVIHGGLRYLEHGELSLVRESLRERQRLLAESGNLIRPLHFILAIPPGSKRSALEIRFGLWLYRRFAKQPPTDRDGELAQFERYLDKGKPWSLFSFDDAQCEYPERLIAEWLHATTSQGVEVRNHAEALEVIKSDGFVTGVRVRDKLTGAEYTVEADWVVNATGPWADFVCQRSNIVTDDPLVGGVRGSHIVLPSFEAGPKSAIYTEAVDGRPIFVVPWADQLLVGTTEVSDDRNPDYVTPAPDEIDYLLRSFNRLFPALPIGRTDIRAAFAGVRPLPYIAEQSPSSITRRHFLIDHKDDGAQRMISIIGGKLTTAVSLAREVARAIGINVLEPKGFALAEPPDDTAGLSTIYREMVEFSRIPMASVKAVVSLFGPFAVTVFNTIQQDDSHRRTLCPHTDHVVGEAVYAVRREFAITLGDILLRRVPVALGPCWSDKCTRMAAERIGAALHWASGEIAHQIHNFEEEYSRFYVRPELKPLNTRH